MIRPNAFRWRRLAEVKRTIWKEPFAWPGGYEIRVYIDGDCMCRECMKAAWPSIVDSVLHGHGEVCIGVHWEGPPDFCGDCGGEMSSEYGDPWAKDGAEDEANEA